MSREANETEINKLQLFLQHSESALAVALCGSSAYRESLVSRLFFFLDQASIPRQELKLSKNDDPAALGRLIHEAGDKARVILIHGLDDHLGIPYPEDDKLKRLSRALNLQREALVRPGCVTLIFLYPEVFKSIVSQAPDFSSWVMATFNFSAPVEPLKESTEFISSSINGLLGIRESKADSELKIDIYQKQLKRAAKRGQEKRTTFREIILPMMKAMVLSGKTSDAFTYYVEYQEFFNFVGAIFRDNDSPQDKAEIMTDVSDIIRALPVITKSASIEKSFELQKNAVEIYQELVKKGNEAFLPHLALSLSTLGAIFNELGRREEALTVTTEAVDIYRELSSSRPDFFLADLGSILIILGNRLSGTGKLKEAAEATEESTEIFRYLVKIKPESFLSSLATSLDALGNRLNRIGKREESIEASKEAVKIFRNLVKEQPEVFQSDLAMALNNLGIELKSLGNIEEALAATKEALGIYRSLSESRADMFLPKVAISLNNVGVGLHSLGKSMQALDAVEEAVNIRRELAQKRPEYFLPPLASSLNNLSDILSSLGKKEEALEAINEGTTIFRGLAKDQPNSFLPSLARSLNNLGIRLGDFGLQEESRLALLESVNIRRELAEVLPEAFLPDLALSLTNLANRLNTLERREEALQMITEALKIRQKLSVDHPESFIPDYVWSLGVLGSIHRDNGHLNDARSAWMQGLELICPLYLKIPSAFARLAINLFHDYLSTFDGDPPPEALELVSRFEGIEKFMNKKEGPGEG